MTRPSAAQGSVAYRFWRLPSSTRREIVEGLIGPFAAEEMALRETDRYTAAFTRMRLAGLVPAFVAALAAAEEAGA